MPGRKTDLADCQWIAELHEHGLLRPTSTAGHHDHRAIDDEAEVDRSQAHQAGGDARQGHQVGREHHGKRNRQSDEKPRAEAPQHDQQHCDDQDSPLGQVGR